MTGGSVAFLMAGMAATAVAGASCGKKGPPQAPLMIAPAAVSGLSAGRLGDRVTIRFTLPDKNTDNSTPADLARVDVFALSVDNAADAAEAGTVVREGVRVGSIEAARPAAAEASETNENHRAFVETLSGETLKTWKPVRPARQAPPVPVAVADEPSEEEPVNATAAKSSAEPAQPGPVRVYALLPVSRKGRRGPATLATIPLGPAPPSPPPPFITYTDKAISLIWPASDKTLAYNVYAVPRASRPAHPQGPGAPLNKAPLKEATFEDAGLEFGKERCYTITTVETVKQQAVESELSTPACVTPVDTFAPPAPAGLAAVAGPGAMSLIWDAVNAPDLAGYLVLRGVAPGDTLQTLTPEPIKETTFRDASVTPGTRYVYVVVAVDRSKNASPQSARVEEMAR